MYDIPITYVEAGATYTPGTSSTYAARTEPVPMIGCTCGGRSACKGTCRTPLY